MNLPWEKLILLCALSLAGGAESSGYVPTYYQPAYEQPALPATGPGAAPFTTTPLPHAPIGGGYDAFSPWRVNKGQPGIFHIGYASSRLAELSSPTGC